MIIEQFGNPEIKDLEYYRREIDEELEITRKMVEEAEAKDGKLPDAVFDLRATLYGLAMEMAPDSRKGDLVSMHDLIKPQPGETAVDVAAGTGFLTRSLAEWTDGETFAIDPSAGQLDILKKDCPDVITITTFPENDEMLIAIPENSVDIATSFGGIHHNKHQAELFANIARMLKPGGRFVAADVRKDTSLSDHFDDVVDKKCLTHHDMGEWLSEEGLAELCADLPLEIVHTEMKQLTWDFNSKEEMAVFFKGLHAYDLPENEVIADLENTLGFKEEDGKIKLNWPMLFFEIIKKEK